MPISKLPNIGLDWDFFKDIEESGVDDMSQFGFILLTLVKGDKVILLGYELDTQTWGLLQA